MSSAADLLPREHLTDDAPADSPAHTRPDGTDVIAVGERPKVDPPYSARRWREPLPALDTARGWIVTAVITVIGAIVRFWDLGGKTDGGTPIFDEKYYAIHAAEVLRNGGIEDNPGFGVVVHPQLGKQLIALGEHLFGYNAFGWRFTSAVIGTICILLMVRIGRRLTGSTFLGAIAGILFIADGVSHVQARVALLDGAQTVFILGAFACLLADRAQVRARLSEAALGLSDAPGADGPWGIKLGARWWRFGVGFLLGCATAVKWSGLYYIAFFGVLSVVWDVLARREAGIRRPVTAVARRDLLPSLWSYVVIGIGTYIASWWAWFRSESAWARHILVGDVSTWNTDKGGTGILHKLANLWDNALWQWNWKMLDFHSTLLTPGAPGSTSDGKAHPWESKPWTWPMGTRPVLYYAPSDLDVPGCSNSTGACVQRIFLMPTAAMWFLALFIAGWVLWRAVFRTDWRYVAVLVAYCAGFLPWFVNLDRQMYFFYATPLAPFLVLAIVLILGDILSSKGSGKTLGVERRYLAIAVVAIYVGIVIANFVFLWPMINGVPITKARLTLSTWIPSWG